MMALRAPAAALALLLGAGVNAEHCVQSTMYSSGRPGNKNLRSRPLNSESTQECSDLCKSTQGCTCFTYNSARNQCWLMSKCTTPTTGPKFKVFNAGPAGCVDPHHIKEAKPLKPETQPAECQLGAEDAEPGMKVYRGADWKWKSQDGGYGNEGTLIAMVDKCPKGAWWRVSWAATGVSNVYRVGCSNKHDLRMAKCGEDDTSVCRFDELFWPVGALPAASNPRGCERGGRVKNNQVCAFEREGFVCEPAVCRGDDEVVTWANMRLTCRNASEPAPVKAVEVAPVKVEAIKPQPVVERRTPEPTPTSLPPKTPEPTPTHFPPKTPEPTPTHFPPKTPAPPTPAPTPAGPCKLDVSQVSKGMMVVRGPDWRWKGQDGNGPGRVMSIAPQKCVGGVWARVQWHSSGLQNIYRVGCSGKYDLCPLQASAGGRATPAAGRGGGAAAPAGRGAPAPAPAPPAVAATPATKAAPAPVLTAAPTQPAGPCRLHFNQTRKGMRVVRGADWRWKDQDGHAPGVITSVSQQRCKGGRWVRVQWPATGIENIYRAGCNGESDLCAFVAEQRGIGSAAARASPSAGRGGAGRGVGAVKAPAQPATAPVAAPVVTEAPKQPAEAAAPKQEVYSCSIDQTMTSEVLLELPEVKNVQVCQGYCSQLDECAAVTFHTLRRSCQIRKSGPRTVADDVQLCTRDSKPQVTEVAAPKKADVYQCEAGKSFASGDLQRFGNVGSLLQCKAACSKSADCVGLIHSASAMTCTLKAFYTTAQDAAADVTACLRNAEFKAEQQESRRGEVQEVARRATPMGDFTLGGEWTEVEVVIGGKVVTTWVKLNQTSGENITVYETPEGFGYNCTYGHWFEGGSLFKLVGVPDPYKCQQTCDALPQCVSWVHRGACPPIRQQTGIWVPNTTARCYTCDIKAHGNATLKEDDAWRNTLTCVSTERLQQELDWKGKTVMYIDNCNCSDLMEDQAEQTAFLDDVYAMMACQARGIVRASLAVASFETCGAGTCSDLPIVGASRKAAQLSKGRMWRPTKHRHAVSLQTDEFCKVAVTFDLPDGTPAEDVDEIVEECSNNLQVTGEARTTCKVPAVETESEVDWNITSCEWETYDENPQCASLTEAQCGSDVGCIHTDRNPENCSDLGSKQCVDNQCTAGKDLPDDCCIGTDRHVSSLEECKQRCQLMTEFPKCVAVSYHEADCLCKLYKGCCDPVNATDPATQLCTMPYNRTDECRTPAPTGIRVCYAFELPIWMQNFVDQGMQHLITTHIVDYFTSRGININMSTVVLEAKDLSPAADADKVDQGRGLRWIGNSSTAEFADTPFTGERRRALAASRGALQLNAFIDPAPGSKADLAMSDLMKRQAVADAAAAVMRKVRPQRYHCETSWVYEGGDLQSAEDVENADACLQLCTATKGCAKVTYHSSRLCELKRADATPVVAQGVEGVVACEREQHKPASGGQEYQCESGVAFGGGDIFVAEEVPSAEACRALCDTISGECSLYVYREDQSCHMKVLGEAARIEMPELAGVACTAVRTAMPDEYSCRDGAYLGGDLFSIDDVADMRDCERYCSSVKQCVIAAYDSRRRCQLKNAGAAFQSDPQGWAEGARVCRRVERAGTSKVDPFHCEEGWAYQGDALKQVQQVDTADSCLALCSSTDLCAVVVYRNGDCTLMSETAKPVAENGAVSCARRTRPKPQAKTAEISYTCNTETTYEGSDLYQLENAASADECRPQCTQTPGCAVFVFARGVCFLKGSDAKPLPVAEDAGETVSCVKSKDGEMAAQTLESVLGAATRPSKDALSVRWTCTESTLAGGDLFLLEGIASLRVCQQQCVRLSSCAAVQYDPTTANCVLRTFAATLTLGTDTKSISCLRAQGLPAAAAPPCVCAADWLMPDESGRCGERQKGCPAAACDGSEQRWCRVINPGCMTEGYGGWSYCDDHTPVGGHGVLLDHVHKRQARVESSGSGPQLTFGPNTKDFEIKKKLTEIEQMMTDASFGLWMTGGLGPNTGDGDGDGDGSAAGGPPPPPITTENAMYRVERLLGIDMRPDGQITAIHERSRALLAGMGSAEVGWTIISVAGNAVVQDGTQAEQILQMMHNAAHNFTLTLGMETSPDGLVWFHIFKHLIHVDHLTQSVFRGKTHPNFSLPPVPGLWATTMIRARLNTILAPTVDNWKKISGLMKGEHQSAGNHFSATMNPVLDALNLHSIEAGSIEAPPVHPPVSDMFFSTTRSVKAVLKLKLSSVPTPGEIATLEAAAGLRYAELVGKKDCDGAGANCSAESDECAHGAGQPWEGCLDADGRSISFTRRIAGERGLTDPYGAGGPYEGLNTAERRAVGLSGSVQVSICLDVPQSTSATPAANQAATDAACPDLSSNASAQFAGDSLFMVVGCDVHREPAETPATWCTTPAPTSDSTKDHNATAMPELAPMDAGWEESVSTARRLLQVLPAQTDEDFMRRADRIVAVEREMDVVRDRKGHTLQLDRDYKPHLRQRACCEGAQNEYYGVMSNDYNYPTANAPPITNATLQMCIDYCNAHPGCHGFSRRGLNTTADNETGECYPKRHVFPFVGDQYPFPTPGHGLPANTVDYDQTAVWGTYITSCPPPVDPCEWRVIENTALKDVREYKSHVKVKMADECREICEQLPDCIGASFRRWTHTCYFVHTHNGTTVDHWEFDSYICKRIGATPSPWTRRTPAPIGWGLCEDNGDLHCAAGEGSCCVEGKNSYHCACKDGYHCVGCSPDAMVQDPNCTCDTPLMPKACVRDTPTDAPAGMCDSDPCGADGNLCYQGMRNGSQVYWCGCKPTHKCTQCNRTDVSQQCVPGPAVGTPTPTTMSVEHAWREAWMRTLNEALKADGTCYALDAQGVEMWPDHYTQADFGNGSNAAGAHPPYEPVDAEIAFAVTHSKAVHCVELTLTNLTMDNLFDGSGGIASQPLDLLQQQLADEEGIPIEDVTLGEICLHRAIDENEEIGCFEPTGEPATPGGPVVPNKGLTEFEQGTGVSATVCEKHTAAGPARKGGHTDECDATLQCAAGKEINIQGAFFGREHCYGSLCFSNDRLAGEGRSNCHAQYCDHATGSCNCSSDVAFNNSDVATLPDGVRPHGYPSTYAGSTAYKTVKQTLAERCDGQATCEISANATIFGDACPGENKYLWVDYTCVGTISRRSKTLQDASAQCADGKCSMRLEVKLRLQTKSTVRVLRMAGGKRQQLGAADPLPSHVNVIGTVGEETGVQSEAASEVLAAVQRDHGLKSSAEALGKEVGAKSRSWVQSMDVGAVLTSACVDRVEYPAVDCVSGDGCVPVARADEVVRTSCDGTAACGPAHCNHNGQPSGYGADCSCHCHAGYAGPRCERCAAGYRGYPECDDPNVPRPVLQPVKPAQPVVTAAPTQKQYTDAELRAMELPQVLAVADAAGIKTEVLESKQELILAIRRRQAEIESGTPAPPQHAETEAFFVAMSRSPQWMAGALPSLRRHMKDALAVTNAVDVTLTYLCLPSVCTPQCPPGTVEDWAEELRSEKCVDVKNVTAGDIRWDAVPSSMVEMHVAFPEQNPVHVDLVEAAVSATLRRKSSGLHHMRVAGIMPAYNSSSASSHVLVEPAEHSGVPMAAAALALAAVVALVVACRQTGRGEAALDKQPAPAPDQVILRKGAQDPLSALGIVCNGPATLASVAEGSAAAAAGAGRFVGRRVSHVNGRPVTRAQDVAKLAEGVSQVRLLFADPATAAPAMQTTRFADTEPAAAAPPPQPQRRARISVRSPADVWRECEVTERTPDSVRVHYIGFGEEHDEWIPKGSDRLRHMTALKVGHSVRLTAARAAHEDRAGLTGLGVIVHDLGAAEERPFKVRDGGGSILWCSATELDGGESGFQGHIVGSGGSR
eukprot:TRINITY_DN70_c0_g4_i1.p1 TRINITY_DN70_c0_g4~~TRINITY_DN70_c0_g4_i1.p1  ORF type:complete len:3893 (+),score=1325.81 TRINITY_DN70_c0_g4_i1:111-11681(+)